MEEATWVQAQQFSHPGQLKHYLEEDDPQEEKVSSGEDTIFIKGGVVVTSC